MSRIPSGPLTKECVSELNNKIANVKEIIKNYDDNAHQTLISVKEKLVKIQANNTPEENFSQLMELKGFVNDYDRSAHNDLKTMNHNLQSMDNGICMKEVEFSATVDHIMG